MTWPLLPLRDVIAEPLANGRSVPNRAGGFPVLRLTALRNGAVDLQRCKEGAWSRDDAERYLVRSGDFLVSRGNGSLDLVGRGGLVPLNPDSVAFPDTMIRIRPDRERIEPRFLAHIWESSAVREQIKSSARTTAGIYKINQAQLGAVHIPVPPLDEQRRVVDLLDDHLSRLDAAEAYIAACLRRVETWHSSFVNRAVWADDYPRSSVGGVLREPMRNGRSDRAAKATEPGTRTLTLTAVTRHAFTDENTKLTITSADRAAGLWLEPGDVFVQRSNTPDLVGTAARYDGPTDWAIFPDLLIRLRADESKIDSRFLAAALRSEAGHSQLRRRAKGLAGSMPKIDQAAIAATVIPAPELAVQRQIIQQVERASEALNGLRLELGRTRAHSTALRRSLLTAAFSGRLTGAASSQSRGHPPEEMQVV